MSLEKERLMIEVTSDWNLTLSAILFSIGFIDMMIRKNALIMFICFIIYKALIPPLMYGEC